MLCRSLLKVNPQGGPVAQHLTRSVQSRTVRGEPRLRVALKLPESWHSRRCDPFHASPPSPSPPRQPGSPAAGRAMPRPPPPARDRRAWVGSPSVWPHENRLRCCRICCRADHKPPNFPEKTAGVRVLRGVLSVSPVRVAAAPCKGVRNSLFNLDLYPIRSSASMQPWMSTLGRELAASSGAACAARIRIRVRAEGLEGAADRIWSAIPLTIPATVLTEPKAAHERVLPAMAVRQSPSFDSPGPGAGPFWAWAETDR